MTMAIPTTAVAASRCAIAGRIASTAFVTIWGHARQDEASTESTTTGITSLAIVAGPRDDNSEPISGVIHSSFLTRSILRSKNSRLICALTTTLSVAHIDGQAFR